MLRGGNEMVKGSSSMVIGDQDVTLYSVGIADWPGSRYHLLWGGDVVVIDATLASLSVVMRW